MIDKLLGFLEIDAAAKRSGKILSDLIAPQLDGIIDRLYLPRWSTVRFEFGDRFLWTADAVFDSRIG